MGVFGDIGNAYRSSRDRVLLAREKDVSDFRIREYDIELRAITEGITIRECAATVFGYIFGTYTTFCWTQGQLDRFDDKTACLGSEL